MATKLPGIPGLDVTELGSIQNPTNPSFANGASPEAQQYQSMRSAPSAPGNAAGEAATSRLASVTNGLRGAVNSGAGKVVGGLAVADAIGQGMNNDSTARYAKRFGVDEPTGDGSFGDMAKFAALRAGGFASDLGNNLTGGLAGKYLYADKQPGVMPPAAPPTSLRAPMQPQPGLTPSQAQPAAPTASDNVVMRDGSSFSGTDVKPGFQYQDPNGLRSPSGNMNTVPTVAGLDPALAARLQEAKLGALSRGESLATNQPAFGFNAGGGSGHPDIAALAASGKLTASGLNAVLGARGQDIGAETTMRGQDVTSQGQGLQYDLGRRGEEVTMRGQDLSSATARAQARMQQMQQDRQFNLEVQKFGQDKAKTMWDQREKASKDFNDWAGSLFTTRDDKGQTVQDHGKQSEFMRTVSATLGNQISALETKGDPQSMARAAELKQKGFAALDDEDKSTLKRLFDRRQRFVDTRGPGYTSGSGPVSDNLSDFAITGGDNNMLQNRVAMQGGQSMPMNDLRYTEPANAILPDIFKTPTADLGPTAREAAGLRRPR